MAQLMKYGDGAIPVGGDAWLDDNLPVKVQRVVPPADDLDAGSVHITYSWGAADIVAPGRLGAYIAD